MDRLHPGPLRGLLDTDIFGDGEWGDQDATSVGGDGALHPLDLRGETNDLSDQWITSHRGAQLT